jgi:hypothetical protein
MSRVGLEPTTYGLKVVSRVCCGSVKVIIHRGLSKRTNQDETQVNRGDPIPELPLESPISRQDLDFPSGELPEEQAGADQ